MLACLVTVALKLTGVIGWSWWAVTASFWGGYAAIGVCVAILCVGDVINDAMFREQYGGK